MARKLQTIQFLLPVSILKEGRRFVAYTPALDLSTSGKTLKEARKRFAEAATLFFAELTEMGTAEEVLLNLGWRKHNNEIVPPTEIEHEPMMLSVAV